MVGQAFTSLRIAGCRIDENLKKKIRQSLKFRLSSAILIVIKAAYWPISVGATVPLRALKV